MDSVLNVIIQPVRVNHSHIKANLQQILKTIVTILTQEPLQVDFSLHIQYQLKIEHHMLNYEGDYCILELRKYDHISDGLRSLNWLPIKERLILNDATMMR